MHDTIDYAEVGLRVGLEVHQQLLTEKKMFCHCPAGRYTTEHDGTILRHMRPTLSELGEYGTVPVLHHGVNDALRMHNHIDPGRRHSKEPAGLRQLDVDVEDYRGRRERQLVEVATRAADRVDETGQMLQLEPMSALERRWIHLALRDREGITTQSIGEEPMRRVVVLKA